MKEIKIKHDVLNRLYSEEEKTIYEIAREFGCSSTTISDKLKKFHIKTRERKISIPKEVINHIKNKKSIKDIALHYGVSEGHVYRELKRNKIHISGRRKYLPITKNELEDMYVKQNKSAKQISKELNVSRELVYTNLRSWKIPIRPDNSKKRVNDIPKDILSDMYVKQNCHVNEIMKKFNCSKYHVYRQLDKHDIPRRNSGTIPRTIISKEYLEKLYIKEEKPIKEIAKEFKCNPGTIIKKLKEFKIKIKGANLSKRLTKEILAELYSKYTAKEIADIYNCDIGTIHSYLNKFKIPIKRDYSKPEYAEKRKIRKLAEQRLEEMKVIYGNKCNICNSEKVLTIHHMYYTQNDIVDRNYKSSERYRYHFDLYDEVKKEPKRFKLLCKSCHQIVGRLQALPREKREILIAKLKEQKKLREKYPTKHEDLLNGK